MQLSIAATLLAACAAVNAFSDSSPFILFSTAELPSPPTDAQLQTSSQVLAAAKQLLASCPTERYVLVSEPNVHAADIRDGAAGANSRCQMPSLCRAVASEATRGRFSVAEVIGQVSSGPLKEYVQEACAKKGKTAVTVDKVELRHLPAVSVREEDAAERRMVLAQNDYELGQLLESLEGEQYTVVILSDPNEFKAYEPEFVQPVHMDLKRQPKESVAFIGRRAGDSKYDNRPLFEKYQFFTPGVFMALVTLVVILSILTVGLKALASLEVSYGAFDKDMGPAAQKKQQ
ncbi:BIG/ATPase V1 complex, subunit S1 [Bombardia bombarda]|uniref:Protein BIG1 n=1 Tax=Bombardia bombarda TaxID=252184 RepID=A0AA40CGB4_9PEZI|nr:BIG/ATPase V1 complex, subunit S1 [Bombardia bombarda]